MTSTIDRNQLENVLRDAGLEWLVKYWGNRKDEHLETTVQGLEEFAEEYNRRFGERPDPLTLVQKNRDKGKAFFQLDTLLLSPQFKVAVWRILLGCEVAELEVKYTQNSGSSIQLTLRTPHGEQEKYESHYWHDFRVLRHFGLTGINERPLLQGYFALR